jgi:hypothetical protein
MKTSEFKETIKRMVAGIVEARANVAANASYDTVKLLVAADELRMRQIRLAYFIEDHISVVVWEPEEK